MKYPMVCEKSDTGWEAHAPDSTRSRVAGKTLDEVKELVREAIEFHLEGVRENGDAIPPPSAPQNTSTFEVAVHRIKQMLTALQVDIVLLPT
jgi:predicted RNase H-like HicB family nuclease